MNLSDVFKLNPAVTDDEVAFGKQVGCLGFMLGLGIGMLAALALCR